MLGEKALFGVTCVFCTTKNYITHLKTGKIPKKHNRAKFDKFGE